MIPDENAALGVCGLCGRNPQELEQTIKQLRDERDACAVAMDIEHDRAIAAEKAARWLFANLDHADECDIEGSALRNWPWLEDDSA